MIAVLRARLARVRTFFSKERLDRDFASELAAHLDLAAEDHQRRGLSPQEARRRALLELGDVEAAKELHREARGLPSLDAWLQDLRFAFRTLRRDAGFTASAVAILGLGIGANTAISSVVDGVLLRPVPVEGIERLARVWQTEIGPAAPRASPPRCPTSSTSGRAAAPSSASRP